jgi:hypothetical protein
MPESEQGARKELSEGIKSILQRIADFFDIFDMSFIISGAVCMGAFAFCVWRAKVNLPLLPEGWPLYIIIIVSSYVLGLACFVLGRWTRLNWRWSRLGDPSSRLLPILERHGLRDTPPFAEYLERGGGEALYVRLWAEARDSPTVAASFSLLRRYWVMAATCDGLVVALSVWIIVLLASSFGLDDPKRIGATTAVVASAVLAIIAFAFRHEAGRFVDYQLQELIATIAAIRSKK